MATGVVSDSRYLDHEMGPGHVESPARAAVINRMVEEEAAGLNLVRVEPRPADEEELAAVHERRYLDLLKSTAGKSVFVFDPDTSASPATWRTALLAAGGLLRAVDLVMEGRLRNAFAAVRPPGHHAEPARAMGFCFINNVAVAAEHLARRHGLERVLVVDWDVHHGNGTELAFFERRDVLFFSTHQVPLYPGTGAVRHVGAGTGEGFNLNVPLLRGKGDAQYRFVFERLLEPVALQYRPEFILVSAGFDIALGDPLAGMEVTAAGFGALTASVVRLADECCGGRLAMTLEGGYNLAAMKDGVREVLRVMAGGEAGPVPALPPDDPLLSELAPCFRVFGGYWRLPAA
jgi:acetoin utilization deacetylase AcuC-like enzyme